MISNNRQKGQHWSGRIQVSIVPFSRQDNESLSKTQLSSKGDLQDLQINTGKEFPSDSVSQAEGVQI